jgi:predicted transcriptional regulator of viral defense system
MNFQEFRIAFNDLACVSTNQVLAWYPGFDKNNLGRWVKNGFMVKLRNSYYCFPEFLNKPGFSFYVGNLIYRPSYISLHSALSYYGLIPEAVVQVTSVSSLKTAAFTNPCGTFLYNTLKPELMFGYDLKSYPNSWTVNLAQPEKALIDLLYLNPYYNTQQELELLRLDNDILQENLNVDLLKDYVLKYKNHALENRVSMLLKAYSL